MTTIQTPVYSGPDRRRRYVYVTKNHEYHCLDGICIAVRDLYTEEFVREHAAIGKQVSAGVRMNNGVIESISPPERVSPGERMHFVEGVDDPRDVLTSPLHKVARPPRETVAEYDARAAGRR